MNIQSRTLYFIIICLFALAAVAATGAQERETDTGILVLQAAHTGDFSFITSAALTHDGMLAATGGEDRIVKLFSTENGRLLRSFSGHIGAVTAMVFSDDGTILHSGDTEGKIIIRDIRNGNIISTTTAPDAINTMVVGGDGTLFAGGGASWAEKGFVMAYSPESSEILFQSELSGIVNSLAITPDETHLAAGTGRTIGFQGGGSATFDAFVEVFNTTNGRSITTFGKDWEEQEVISCLVARNDTELICVQRDGTVRLWNLDSGAYTDLAQVAEYPEVAHLVRENSLGVVSADGYALIDLTSSIITKQGTLNALKPGMRLETAALDSEFRAVLGTYDSGIPVLADLERGRLLPALNLSSISHISDFVLFPSGSLAYLGCANGTILTFDYESLRITATRPSQMHSHGGSMAINSEGDELAVSMGNGAVIVYNPVNFRPVRNSSTHGTYSDDIGYIGKALWVAGTVMHSPPPRFDITEEGTGKVLFEQQELENGLNIPPVDGGVFFRRTWNDQVCITDISNLSPLQVADPESLDLIADGPGNYYAYTVGESLYIEPKVVGSGGAIRHTIPAGELEAIAFSPDDTAVALGYLDGSMLILDRASGTVLFQSEDMCAAISQMVFSPDSAKLIIAHEFGSLRILNRESREFYDLYTDGTEWMTIDSSGPVSYSRGGAALVGVTRDGRSHPWTP